MAIELQNNLIREWLMKRRHIVTLTLRYVAAEKRMVDENQEWASAIAEKRRKRLLAFLLDSYEDELGKIESALAHVGTDDYGRCRLCRKPIDRRRLERLPIADLCFGCEKREQQKEAERKERCRETTSSTRATVADPRQAVTVYPAKRFNSSPTR